MTHERLWTVHKCKVYLQQNYQQWEGRFMYILWDLVGSWLHVQNSEFSAVFVYVHIVLKINVKMFRKHIRELALYKAIATI